jgi:hypothetical protein
MRAYRLGLVVLVVSCFAGVAVPGADALTGFEHSFSFGEGVFGSASAVAVDQSDGDVYVSDFGIESGRLWKYTVDLAGKSAQPEDAFGSGGYLEAPGLPFQSTVDNYAGGNGDLFVPSLEGGTVSKLSPDGAPIPLGSPIEGLTQPVGVGVDETGNIYVALLSGVVLKFNAQGEPVNAAGLVSPENTLVTASSGVRAMAVDPNGEDIYLATEKAVVQYVLSGGEYVQGVSFDNEAFTDGVALAPPGGPAAGDVFVESGGDIYPEIFQYEPTGTLVSQFGAGTGFGGGVLRGGGGVARLGVYGTATSLTLYAPNEGDGVAVFKWLTLPSATTRVAKNITSTTVELCGTINPESNTLVSGYQFEYGTETSSEHVAPLAPVSVGTGESSQEVCTTLEGLNPGETYHYQFIASNEEGHTPGGEQSVKTLPQPPTVENQYTLLAEQTSTIVEVLVDPQNSQSTYHVEYGTSTAYGSSVPIPDGTIGTGLSAIHVEQQLVGLQIGTTYHYRTVATNEAGTTYGPDQTFTTLPPTPPLLGPISVTGITQNGVTLTGTVDPQGVQTSYEFDIGTDTNYGTRIFGEAGSNQGPQAVIAGLQNLTPDTTYHYRLTATNAYGTIYSEDQTFTTPQAPITATLIAPPTPALLPIPTTVFPSTAATTETTKSKRRASKNKKKKVGKATKATKAHRADHAHITHGRGK